ncbi:MULTISPECIES: hypothetical protein [Burkholderia]|jgi:hypothetical protein|uniref:Uncharacterized protein n=2 Tax=Burkholderia contaminans TaxID=488447 RepID=A0A286P5D1_9BURK|nr:MULTISPECIES: hypothetical protein [Burkholderia]UTP24024.1 hypothetical protein NMB33_26020 [Burkholderia sp. FXe9]MBA9832823.1 hypothetical protein [Burkholderia contaminans]MBA9841484.1 hypothetical protein [Burkholderia contaminans]MBA9866723.1 hypothetical protein [Burkholderia contaminans]MBA9909402.1 hypothetical protein [Burkholderia contaminans]
MGDTSTDSFSGKTDQPAPVDGTEIVNGKELLERLAMLSPVGMQVYASSCLRRYCDANGFSHAAIDALLAHLDSIAVAGSLPEWECSGALLELNGRGDPVPAGIESALPEGELQRFMTLVEAVVEVGIVDLYGTRTDQPLAFLRKTIAVLEQGEIPLPPLTNASG